MAEKVEIDIPGIGLIEAKNAASEATLQEILKVMQGTQKAIQQQSKGKSGANQGGQGSGNKEAKEGAENQSKLNKQTKDGIGAAKTFAAAGKLAGASFKLVGQSAHLAAYSISGLAAGAGAAAGAIVGLTRNTVELGAKFAETLQRMADVGDSTTRAAGALSMIPIVGGPLAGAFSAVAGAVEGSVKSYQTAASVGATFNGSVQDMSRAAGGAGMTLDNFANLLAKNSEALMLLGGTTEEGAKQFAGLAKGIQQSGVGAELQRLGFTTEQINGGMAKHIGMLGKTGALQGMNTQQLVASSGAYMKELDALAKITGVSRQQKEDEQAKLMKDAKIRAAMSGLDADQQRQMMSYITSFPAEQQAAIADMIATGNVTTDEAIKLQSMLPGVAEQTMQFGRTLQAGGKINQDTLNQAKNSAILEAKESVKRNKARGLYDAEAGATYVAMADLAAQKVDGYSQAIGEQGKATAKANLAENLTKAKQRLAEFSNGFQQALANPAMLDMLMKSFETLASFVQQVIVPAFNIFAQILSAVIPVVTNLLMPAFKVLGEFMQSTVIPAFNILGIWVRDAIVPIFKQAWSIISETIGSFTKMLGITDDVGDGLGTFEEILYDISYFIEDNLQPILLGFGVLMGAVIVAKVVAFGAAMLSMLAPIGSFVVGLASATWSLMKTAVSVGIAAVQFVGSLTMMAARAIMTSVSFLAVNAPLALAAIAIAGLAWGFKKLGGDLTILADAMKWAGSWVNTLFLKLQLGIYSLLNKIPGMRGDFDKDIQGIGEKLKENEDNRAKLEDDMAKRRKANLDQQKADADKEAADKKKAEAERQAQEAQGDANAVARDEKAAKREEERAARKARREQDAIKNKENAELGAIDAKAEREKAAAEEAKGVTIDKSDPIQMLKTFANQQKSAFTQEAKALDDKDKARSDLALASQEYAKAVEQNGKATNDMERKAAEERMKAAEERLGKANKANQEADEVVKKAAERMTLAKQGKDPGAVSAGTPPSTSGTTAPATSTGTPTVDKAAVTEGVGNLYQQTQDAINKGIKYGFGSKDLKTGAIDCSGWIANINTNMMNSINKEAGKEIYGKEAKKAFQGSAADIIKNVSAAGGGMLEGSKDIRKNLKEGMLIGEDNGAKGWDAGRYKGIDHITQTVKDPKTGKLMISESQGGKGVTMTDPEEYFKRKEAKGVKLFGTDMTAMAKGAEGKVTAPPSATANIPKPELSAAEKEKAAAAEKAKADKARADAAATDPRRTDRTTEAKPVETKPVTATTPAEPKREETLQSLIRDGITPTTIAFQELINKGIKPFQSVMSSGIQIKTPLKGEVPAKESLSPGEELVKATAEAQAKMLQARDPGTGELLSAAKDLSKSSEIQTSLAQNKTRGMYDAEAGKSYVAMAKMLESPLASISDMSKIDLTKSSQAVQPKDVNSSAAFETPKAEIIAQAEKAAAEKAAAKEKEMAEKDAKFKEAMAQTSNQEGALSGSSDLNTALAELIAISRKTADLNEKQLSVQSSLSGDLFA
jgi:hypothetical protein